MYVCMCMCMRVCVCVCVRVCDSDLLHRATMELHTRHRAGEQRTLFEAVSKKTKEKDKDLK